MIVGTFAAGNQRLYDMLNNNPMVRLFRGDVNNDPLTVSRNDNFVAINSAINVDLTGPVSYTHLDVYKRQIVDRIYIGKIPGEGTLALAGLGLCFPIVTLVTAFANLFGVGGAPLCSIARGQKDTEGARKIMANAYFMLLLSGVVITILGIAFHKPILYLFGASGDTYQYASDYMTIYLLGTVFVMTSLGLNPYINSQGFAKIGMLTVLLGAAANIVLDPILIYACLLYTSGCRLSRQAGCLLHHPGEHDRGRHPG